VLDGSVTTVHNDQNQKARSSAIELSNMWGGPGENERRHRPCAKGTKRRAAYTAGRREEKAHGKEKKTGRVRVKGPFVNLERRRGGKAKPPGLEEGRGPCPKIHNRVGEPRGQTAGGLSSRKTERPGMP